MLFAHVKLSQFDAALMWNYGKLPCEDLQQLHKLNPHFKGIVRVGNGYDMIHIETAKQCSIIVSNMPEYDCYFVTISYCTEEVADSATSLMLMLLRKTYIHAIQVMQNKYALAHEMQGTRIRGKRCGIIGLGAIGKAFAMRAKVFGLVVQYYDPYVSHGTDKSLGIEQCDTLDELLATSDVISLHCNLTEETRHILNKQSIAKMKPNSYIINTARGALVEEAALVEALQSGHLSGAALDTLEKEPYTDGHLQHVPHLIITPHCAFYSDASLLEVRTKAAQELKRILENQKPKYCVY